MFTAPDVEIVTAEEVLSPGANETHQTTGRVLPPLPPHCKVTGIIDSKINFELHLPVADAWNGRFAMGGG